MNKDLQEWRAFGQQARLLFGQVLNDCQHEDQNVKVRMKYPSWSKKSSILVLLALFLHHA